MKLGDVVLVTIVKDAVDRKAMVSAILPKPDSKFPRLNLVLVTDLGVRQKKQPGAEFGRIDTLMQVPHVSTNVFQVVAAFWRELK